MIVLIAKGIIRFNTNSLVDVNHSENCLHKSEVIDVK